MSHSLLSGSRIGLIAEGAPDLDVITDFITRLLRPDLQLLPGLFEGEGKRSAYMDYLDAAPLARRVQDHTRLRKLSSFRELMANVEALSI